MLASLASVTVVGQKETQVVMRLRKNPGAYFSAWR